MLWDDVSDQQQHCDDDNDVHKPPAGTFALLKNKNIFALTAVAMVCERLLFRASLSGGLVVGFLFGLYSVVAGRSRELDLQHRLQQ